MENRIYKKKDNNKNKIPKTSNVAVILVTLAVCIGWAAKNKEATKVKCEGSSSYLTKDLPHSVSLNGNEKKSLAVRIIAEEANTKVIVLNELDCYEENKRDETLNKQILRITLHFGEL